MEVWGHCCGGNIPSRRPTWEIPTALSCMSYLGMLPSIFSEMDLSFVPSFCWPVLAPNFNTAAEASGTEPCVETTPSSFRGFLRVSPPCSLPTLVNEVGPGAWRVFFVGSTGNMAAVGAFAA